MKKTKYKLKPEVYLYLLGLIILIVLANKGINIIKENKYHKTIEYKLLSTGYSEKDIDLLKKYYSEKELEKLVTKKQNKYLISIMKDKNYIHKNLDKYLEYLNINSNVTIEELVNNVNLHLDTSFYEETFPANLDAGILTLVNKHYYLDENYEPENLLVISPKYSWGSNGSQKTREEVLNAYIKMHDAAELEDIYLMVNRSYKSYNDLKTQYDNYKNIHGQDEADKELIRPGFNERQLGLTIDILSLQDPTQSTFKDSATYTWLKDNAYRYGFIIRYPEGNENITGTEFIPWIFRYVGEEAAKVIHDQNITFEEYYIYNIENKK